MAGTTLINHILTLQRRRRWTNKNRIDDWRNIVRETMMGVSCADRNLAAAEGIFSPCVFCFDRRIFSPRVFCFDRRNLVTYTHTHHFCTPHALFVLLLSRIPAHFHNSADESK